MFTKESLRDSLRRPGGARPASLLLLLLLAFGAGPAAAWWDEAWGQRTRFTLDTTPQGVAIDESLTGVAVPLRLHSGNFDFAAAQPDGADLRVLAADDKTPLSFRVERYDAANELAVVWVQLQTLLPGSKANAVHVYAGNKSATVQPAGEVFDSATRLAVAFDDSTNRGADRRGTIRTADPVTPEINALLAGGARLSGSAIVWPAGEMLRLVAGSPATVSLWVRPDDVAAGKLFEWGMVQLELQAGKLAARVGSATLIGGELALGRWSHVALTMNGTQARLVVNGVEVAQITAATPAVQGGLSVGAGLRGVVDQIEVSGTARSGAWLQATAAAQGTEGLLMQSVIEDAQAAGGESPGYIGVLVKNLTVDAWIVIIILGVMFVIACWVMVVKMRFIGLADRDNRQFLVRFRGAEANLLKLEQGRSHPHSSLYRLYLAGVRELRKRRVGEGDAPPLSGASLDAVKASVDADLVRESHRLNSQMVWLTIAISGGPFLGLLGTVVGVMITFAAIAAAGDVNVNAIAPGIAAALLATVAGLAVAIPALFGYNYLATRIKNISADMQIFVDEFITRVAEEYGAP